MNRDNTTASRVTAGSDASANVWAPLRFIQRQATKPVFHSSALTGGAARFFFETETHTVPIQDMRDIADTLSIDREGFELLRHQTTVADLYDDAAVETTYYAELEALLRREFGASRIVIFDSTRRSDDGAGAQNPDGLRTPATRVHNDYTVDSGPRRIKDLLGENEAERLAKGARASSRSMSGARSVVRWSVRHSPWRMRPASIPVT